MLRNIIATMVFGLLIGGCASDGGGSSSTVVEGTAMSTPTMSGGGTVSTPAPAAAASSPTPAEAVSAPTISSAAATESTSMNLSRASKNRIAEVVEEETFDTCVARIPRDATTGQKMLAEQTCRRDYAGRR